MIQTLLFLLWGVVAFAGNIDDIKRCANTNVSLEERQALFDELVENFSTLEAELVRIAKNTNADTREQRAYLA